MPLLKPDSDFEKDPRRRQELRLRPVADAIYRQIFGTDIELERFDKEVMLDKRFAIDVQIRLRTGQILLGQEKFLSAVYSTFNSLTVEYMQSAEEKGDWFKLASQLYLTGYESGQGFEPWVLVNWPALVIANLKKALRWHDGANKDGRAQASFKWIDIRDIPVDCIIAQRQIAPAKKDS